MQSNEYKRTLYSAIIKVVANCITLVAVFIGMYESFLYPSEALLVFCYWFFGIAVVNWVLARKLMYYVRNRFADKDEGMVALPGQKRKILVRWKVCPRTSLLERVNAQI